MDTDIKFKRFMNYFSSEAKPDKLIGVALFGLGRAGTVHLQDLLACVRSQVCYVVEESQDRLRVVEEKYKHKIPNAKFLRVTQAAEVFADPSVRAVLVCTPTFSHKGIVCQALSAGKYVFCEKPVAESNEGVLECYNTAKANGVKLFCAFNRRYDPGMRRIKNKILNGELGDIFMVKTTSRDSPMPSIGYLLTSGGIFFDTVVHDIDAICWLMGEKPTRVQVFGSNLVSDLEEIKGQDFDTVTVNMQFASDKLALIDLSRAASCGYDQRCEVFGSKGMLENRNLRQNSVEQNSWDASKQDPICYSFPSRYQESYTIELQYFFDLVEGKAEEEILEEEVLATSKIATACEKSAKEGIVVTLDW